LTNITHKDYNILDYTFFSWLNKSKFVHKNYLKILIEIIICIHKYPGSFSKIL
jgi:hypothetical protein